MGIRSLLAVTAAALALFASVAQAQEATPGVHPPYTTQTYLYRDSDGPGRMTIVDLGPAPGGTFDLIRVTLVQNNITYAGSGYSMQISPVNPAEAMFFVMSDPRNNAYVFSGVLTTGTGGVTGGGTYHAAGSPRWTNAWRIEGVAPAN
jgi:hypothetical protein